MCRITVEIARWQRFALLLEGDQARHRGRHWQSCSSQAPASWSSNSFPRSLIPAREIGELHGTREPH
eukprot:3678550-Rhodomonas_salina.1